LPICTHLGTQHVGGGETRGESKAATEILQCFAVSGGVLLCAVVHCSVLHFVAVRRERQKSLSERTFGEKGLFFLERFFFLKKADNSMTQAMITQTTTQATTEKGSWCKGQRKVASATHLLSHGCVAVCCSVLQRVAVCCSVLQCVAVCCNVLQRVAACCKT